MAAPRHPNVGQQEFFKLVYDHAKLDSAVEGTVTTPATVVTIPVAATLSPAITCLAKASYVDTDFMTIIDEYGLAKLFEFDTAGDGVTAGRIQVNISADTTAADVAARLVTAIVANCPWLTVLDNVDGTIDLTHKRPGVAGNEVIITDDVANAGHVVVSPMASGADAVAGSAGSAGTAGTAGGPHTATETFKLFTAERRIRVDRVELLSRDGLAAHATNYWDITVKKDAVIVADWSTKTGEEGTLAADTLADMSLSTTDTELVIAVTDIVSLVLTKVAAAANLPPGRLVIHGRYV